MAGSGYWLRDSFGRVGQIVEAGVIRYAYGQQRAPVAGITVLPAADGEREFEEQRARMWSDCVKLEPVSHAVLKRLGCLRGTDRHEQLHCDVGVPTLCLASVMYAPDRTGGGGSLKQYAAHLLRNSYRRALRGPSEADRTVRVTDTHRDDRQREPSVGLGDREELYSLGLSDDDLSTLLSRFDSGESLDDIAADLGVSSRSTALNHIRRILERCRRDNQD